MGYLANGIGLAPGREEKTDETPRVTVMAYKNIFNWPSIIILLLSGLLLLSSCAGLPVTGMVGGQPIDTRVDSEVARYYLETTLPVITAIPRSMRVSIAFTRAPIVICPTVATSNI